jgi:hypothetical protein
MTWAALPMTSAERWTPIEILGIGEVIFQPLREGRMRKLWILCFALVVLGGNSAGAIGTKKHWDGSQREPGFGCPNDTTFGQVITIPKHRHTLNKFTFWWVRSTNGSMVVRGEVYAWDGSKATGNSLYESSPRTIAFTDDAFHEESFATHGIAVTPGAQYVIFASIDKDYDQCVDSYVLAWGVVDDSVYPAGTFVFLNSGGDYGKWTTQSWQTAGLDLAFKAAVKR